MLERPAPHHVYTFREVALLDPYPNELVIGREAQPTTKQNVLKVEERPFSFGEVQARCQGRFNLKKDRINNYRKPKRLLQELKTLFRPHEMRKERIAVMIDPADAGGLYFAIRSVKEMECYYQKIP